jgi:hypothetical protein
VLGSRHQLVLPEIWAGQQCWHEATLLTHRHRSGATLAIAAYAYLLLPVPHSHTQFYPVVLFCCCSWFEEQASCRVQRAQADVCLPRLPGPGPGPAAAAAAGAGGDTSSSSIPEPPSNASEGVGFQVCSSRYYHLHCIMRRFHRTATFSRSWIMRTCKSCVEAVCGA